MKGNTLEICEDCGNRYYSEKAKEQLAKHHEACEPHQSALTEAAKAKATPPAPTPAVDPEWEPPDAGRRRAAAKPAEEKTQKAADRKL
jgi:hypothetical protein